MANPFDQFDQPPAPQQQTAATNPFDAFDAPATTQPKTQTTSQGLGFEQHAMNAWDNAAQMAKRVLNDVSVSHYMGKPGLGDEIDSLGKSLGMSTTDEAAKQHADYVKAQQAKGIQPGWLGGFAGDVLATAPLAAATDNPVLLGAGSGALTSQAKTPGGTAVDAALGGAGGKLADWGVNKLASAVAPTLSPYVQKLLQEGVDLTPGQILGGTAKRAEDAATSIPILGDAVRSAQNRSTQSLNRAVINRALDPIGQKLPSSVPVGRQAVDHLYDAISGSYNNLLPQMTGVADQTLQNDFNAIGQRAIGQGAKQDVLDRFENVLNAQVKDRVINGQLTGQALKDAQSNLGNIGRSLASSRDADDRMLGRMVIDSHGAFNDMLARANPQFADELANTNNAFAQYARIRKAASYTGAKEGIFSAPQLSRAVQSSDKSAGKGAFARGKAPGQDLSDAANAVLPSQINDSGTAGRLMLGALTLGGLHEVHPGAVLAPLAAAGLYTKPALKGITAAMTKRPQAAQGIAQGMRDYLPGPVATGAGILAGQTPQMAAQP